MICTANAIENLHRVAVKYRVAIKYRMAAMQLQVQVSTAVTAAQREVYNERYHLLGVRGVAGGSSHRLRDSRFGQSKICKRVRAG
jgi:hypothetical protein